MSRQFDLRDHAIKIMIAAPVLAVVVAFSIALGIKWYRDHYGGSGLPKTVVLLMFAISGLLAAVGSGAGGLLMRRRLSLRIVACAGGAILGLAAYGGLMFAVNAILFAYYTW